MSFAPLDDCLSDGLYLKKGKKGAKGKGSKKGKQANEEKYV